MLKIGILCQNTIPELTRLCFGDSKSLLELSTHALPIWLNVQCATALYTTLLWNEAVYFSGSLFSFSTTFWSHS